MNDRFKFRYFNKETNKMVEATNWQNIDGIYECLKQQICFDENIPPLPYDHIGTGLVFMQCTGLKDKNGKLIYEGDIIKRDSEMLQQYVINWNDKGFWCADDNALAFAKDTISTNYEVIGNIWENADLLEE